jgi:prolyl 4-hydroxylase
VSHNRISKSGWLDDTEHKHIRAISLRVQDMTRMTVDTAEQLQVVNYGVGGHYAPHFDFARKTEESNLAYLGTGNRVATVLFYVRNQED